MPHAMGDIIIGISRAAATDSIGYRIRRLLGIGLTLIFSAKYLHV